MKMKIYVVTLSEVFPTTHPRKGEPTCFKEKVLAAINCYGGWMKYHTIRANYELWKKRFEEIDAGRACLCIRQLTGKPYASKQVEIVRLTREDGIGLQKFEFTPDVNGNILWNWFSIDGSFKMHISSKDIARNDGLEYKDWQDWFKNYDDSKPLAIIHFTKFRY